MRFIRSLKQRRQRDPFADLIPNGCKRTFLDGWVRGTLPEGCRLCMAGRKVVYFSGGDCTLPPKCSYYCPISKERKSPDARFADELPIEQPYSLEETIARLVYESNKIEAGGMSITGGDPLSSSRKVKWTASIIAGMKAHMGNDYHIHLYTSGVGFGADYAKLLENSGLDAIRFHPAREDFKKIELAMGHSYKVAAEVPVIPTEENHQYLLELADFLENIGADYLNLNEFEMVEPNSRELQSMGFKLREGSIAGVEGSAEYAKRFMEEFLPGTTLTVHFCSSAMKDSVQLRNRYINRARNIARPFEEITDDGTLIFFRLNGPENELRKLYRDLKNESGVPIDQMELNLEENYLDLPPFLAEDRSFIGFLDKYAVYGGLHEILPFREEEGVYQQVEYTPIKS